MTLASDPTDPFYNLDVTAYRASKAAVNMVAVQQAKTLGREGIKVFAVDPGWRVSSWMNCCAVDGLGGFMFFFIRGMILRFFLR